MAEVERLGKARVRSLTINRVKLTATAAELNALAGSGATAADLTKLHALTPAAADLNLLAGMAAAGQQVRKVAKVALAGATIHGGVQAWANPEAGSIIINRVTVDATTKSSAAGTLSVGTTATSATTASANLIDTLDVGTAAGIFDNVGSPGAGGKATQKLAAGKWVTFSETSGNVTGLVGSLYIDYVLA